jgi:hypothetical protein
MCVQLPCVTWRSDVRVRLTRGCDVASDVAGVEKLSMWASTIHILWYWGEVWGGGAIVLRLYFSTDRTYKMESEIPAVTLYVFKKRTTTTQTGPGAHPASHITSTGSLSGGVGGGERPAHGFDNLPASRVEVKEKAELYFYYPCGPSWPVLGRTLPLLYIYKVVQIWPGLIVCKLVTVCPGHIWTTLYTSSVKKYSGM